MSNHQLCICQPFPQPNVDWTQPDDDGNHSVQYLTLLKFKTIDLYYCWLFAIYSNK